MGLVDEHDGDSDHGKGRQMSDSRGGESVKASKQVRIASLKLSRRCGER